VSQAQPATEREIRSSRWLLGGLVAVRWFRVAPVDVGVGSQDERQHREEKEGDSAYKVAVVSIGVELSDYAKCGRNGGDNEEPGKLPAGMFVIRRSTGLALRVTGPDSIY